MNSHELWERAQESQLLSKWHWFGWHFRFGSGPQAHPFAAAIVDALVAVDKLLPGFAVRMLDDLAALSGVEKHEPHYEQLLQRLAEVHVILRVVSYPWPFAATFSWDATPTEKVDKNRDATHLAGP